MSKKKRQLLIIGSIVLAIVLIGGSYAWFQITLNGTKDNTIKTGTLALELDDKTTPGITITDGVPMLEEVGLTKDGYTFTLTNKGTVNSKYTIYLDDMPLLDGETKLEDKYIRYNLQRDIGNLSKTKLLSGLKPSPDRVLETGIIKPGEKYTYTLRLWIDSNADNGAMGKVFRGRIRVEAIQEVEYLPNTLVRGTGEYNLSGYFWDYKSSIKKVVFESEKKAPENPVQTWDLSVAEDNSIVGYLTGDKKLGHTLYIQANGPIYANPNSTGFFMNFSSIKSFEGLENLDTSNVVSMAGMFMNNSMLTSLDLSSFDTSNVTSMISMFSDNLRLANLNLDGFDTSNVTNMSWMFNHCRVLLNLDLGSFNTTNVTDMSQMFANCYELINLNISSFDTSNVTNMSCMFAECRCLKAVDLSKFNTSRVTNMESMFYGCWVLPSINVSTFDTSNVTDMTQMFYNCSAIVDLDLSNFNTSSVIYMSSMFSFCSSLTGLDLSSFNTSNVIDMVDPFPNGGGFLTLNIRNFTFEKLKNFHDIFLRISNTTIIIVKDVELQNWVIEKGADKGFSTSNVIIR